MRIAAINVFGLGLLAVGACLLGGAGCSKNDAQDGKTVVSLATSGGDRQEKMFDELIPIFEKANPDIKIRRLDIPQTALYIKLQVMIAGKCAPDIIPMMSMRVPMFMHRYALLPLDDLMAQDPAFMELYKNDFWPGSFQGLQMNGKTYVIPWLQNPYALYYNKKIFDDYERDTGEKLGYPDASWDLAKFVSVAKKLTRGEGAEKIYGTNITGTYFYVLCPILRRFGVELFDPQGTRCNLDDPRAIAAMQWYFDLALKDGVAPDPRSGSGGRGSGNVSGGPQDMFIAGHVAMWEAEGEWRFEFSDKIKSFQWDIAEPPHGPARSCGYECFGMSISSTSEHPNEAWRFISFLASPTGQEIMTRNHVGVPVLKSLCESKDCFMKPEELPPSKQIYLQTAQYGKDIPSLRNFQEVESAVMEELDQARFGAKDVASACRAAARAANKLLAEDARED